MRYMEDDSVREMALIDHQGRPISRHNGSNPSGNYTVRHISVRLSKSKEFGKQGWRSVEMTSFAELDEGADASVERNNLYEEIKGDLEMLFEPWEIAAANHNGNGGR